MKTIIVFNAPPNSGKDVSCEYLVKNYGAYHTYFKKRLYEVAAMVANVPLAYMRLVASDRKFKEVPDYNFGINGNDVSPRQWLIHVSENIVKPLLGKEYFGDCLSNEIRSVKNDLVVVSDGGFQEELLALQYSPDYPFDRTIPRIHVVQLTRQGCSFNNDSRRYFDAEYLSVNHITCSVIANEGTLDDLYMQLDDVMKSCGYYKENK